MLLFAQRLHEVARYYQTGDHHLALRRLLDAALETRDTTVFEKVLAFCETAEQTPNTYPETQVSELLQVIEKAAPAPGSMPATPVIEVRGAGKTYSRGKFKLAPVTLQLKPCEIAGLVGENGNGKTTLLRIMAGELNPDTGTVEYRLSNQPTDIYSRRTALAFIPQRIPRWWGTLTDNLQLAARHYGLTGHYNYLWVEMIIARLGLRPYKNLSWNTISSGYRTRFEIARTLLRRPEVLLLDEPLANLDIISQQTILHDLRYLAQSTAHPMAIVLSSQQIYEVEKVSDKIVFLKQGSPVYQDLRETNTGTEEARTLFEIETTATRANLQQVLAHLPLLQLQYNGGVYVATFEPTVTAALLMNALGKAEVEVTYLRNISQSSRRFFTNP